MLLPHEVLGVPADADIVTIKRVFRALAKEWHPDRSHDPKASDRFRDLLGAYRHLIHARAHRDHHAPAVSRSAFDPAARPSWVAATYVASGDDLSWEDRRPAIATAYPARVARIIFVATVGTLALFWGSAFLSHL